MASAIHFKKLNSYEKTSRQVCSGGNVMAAGSEASLAGSLLNDSPLAQEVRQTLRRFTKAQLRERGCSPSGSQFGENRSLPLGPSFADSRRAGAGGESDPCPLLIIEDVVDKPAEVPTVDAVNMILFMEVRHSFAVPEIDGLMIVQGDVGHRFPFVVIESLFHMTNALPRVPLRAGRGNFLGFILAGIAMQNNSKFLTL